MANDLVFSAQLDLEVNDAIKKIEGSLPKIGVGLEKEMQKSTKNTFKKYMKGAWGTIQGVAGVGVSAMSGLMNPNMTTQEMMATVVPQVAKMSLEKVPYVGGMMAATATTGLMHSYQQQNFVHSGAKQSAFSALEEMASRGQEPTDEMIDDVYMAYRNQRKAMWNVRTRATKRIQQTESSLEDGFKLGPGSGVTDVTSAVSEGIKLVKEQIKDSVAGLGEILKSLAESIIGGDGIDVNTAIDAYIKKIDTISNPSQKE